MNLAHFKGISDLEIVVEGIGAQEDKPEEEDNEDIWVPAFEADEYLEAFNGGVSKRKACKMKSFTSKSSEKS